MFQTSDLQVFEFSSFVGIFSARFKVSLFEMKATHNCIFAWAPIFSWDGLYPLFFSPRILWKDMT